MQTNEWLENCVPNSVCLYQLKGLPSKCAGKYWFYWYPKYLFRLLVRLHTPNNSLNSTPGGIILQSLPLLTIFEMLFSCCLFSCFPSADWNGMCVGFLAYFLATFIIMAYCSMKSVSVMLGCNSEMRRGATGGQGGTGRGKIGKKEEPNDCGLNALSFVCTALSKHKSQALPTLAHTLTEAHPLYTHTHIPHPLT